VQAKASSAAAAAQARMASHSSCKDGVAQQLSERVYIEEAGDGRRDLTLEKLGIMKLIYILRQTDRQDTRPALNRRTSC
jgi:hypothetical protein